MTESYPYSGEGIKSLYEALGELQEEITEREKFEYRNVFREDWRGWKYDVECSCARCSRMG